MKIFLLFLFIVSFFNNVCAQEVRASWRKIIPLHSGRAEVEKEIGQPIGSLVSDEVFKYKVEEQIVTIRYSKDRCVEHGWNVPPNTVLSYTVSPKTPITIKKINFDLNKFIETVDDIYNVYYTNQNQGIQYVTTSLGEISYVEYTPANSDSHLRCKGFPEYSSVSKTYVPFDRYNIRYSDFDLARTDTVIMKAQNSDYVGYIFIYMNKDAAKNSRYLEKMKRYIYETRKVPKDKIKVYFGGYRDESEIELFLLPKHYPEPVASPKYASPK